MPQASQHGFKNKVFESKPWPHAMDATEYRFIMARMYQPEDTKERCESQHRETEEPREVP